MERRGFLGALASVGLLEALWSRELLAADGVALLGPWFRELAARARELRGQQMRDVEFAQRLAELLGRVDGDKPARLTKSIPPRTRRAVLRRDRGRCIVPG